MRNRLTTAPRFSYDQLGNRLLPAGSSSFVVIGAIDPCETPRAEVATEYGYPWLWHARALVKGYAVERDVDIRELANCWDEPYEQLQEWIRCHGFHTENSLVKR